MKILNPATGAVVRDIDTDTPAMVKRKFAAARAAQPRWAAIPVRKRLQAIQGFRERVVAEQDTLAATLTKEVGKPIRQSRNELTGLLTRLDFFLQASAKVLRPENVHAD